MTTTILAVIALCGGLGHALSWLPVERTDDASRVYGWSVVELLCGFLLLAAAFSLRSIRPGAWRGALSAHVVALLCLALGSVLFAVASHVVSLWTLTFHGLLFAMTALNTAGLWRLRPRNPLKRAQHEMAARLY